MSFKFIRKAWILKLFPPAPRHQPTDPEHQQRPSRGLGNALNRNVVDKNVQIRGPSGSTHGKFIPRRQAHTYPGLGEKIGSPADRVPRPHGAAGVENKGAANEVTYKYGSKFTLGDGVVYIADHFIKNDSQTVILDKYKNTPSYKIGLVPSKSFIDTVDDQSLLDNAQGTPNFQALGADRLKISTVLTKIALSANTDETEFIGITEVESGLLKRKFTPEVESKLEEAIAKRTFEESGNYTLSDPNIFVREHLSQSGDRKSVV